MRFSEAIRLGAMTGPQSFGKLENGDATCAIGAAYRATGSRNSGELMAACPSWKDVTVAACPACGRVPANCDVDTIPHLNDEHRWTREQIANWVESIENAQTPQPEPVAAEVPSCTPAT